MSEEEALVQAKELLKKEHEAKLIREQAVSDGIKKLLEEHKCTFDVALQIRHKQDPIVQISPVAL